ncbi:helix-turn-helix transcriptional regulator [Uliginosibacterium sp. sgz301328]|uniref:helix-turn-helix transcriptional regulator n=1 Tax=Uliginosibacterium sp. sgz301328 TaxID=3243764 RepID=UPI00359DCA06
MMNTQQHNAGYVANVDVIEPIVVRAHDAARILGMRRESFRKLVMARGLTKVRLGPRQVGYYLADIRAVANDLPRA